jgi:hypothetical protein
VALSAWYAAHLGIQAEESGSLIFAGPETDGMTVFFHLPLNTAYFGEGNQQAMLNFRVDDLDKLLEQLEAAGERIDPKRDTVPYGCFAWIWDPERNRVELWQAPLES